MRTIAVTAVLALSLGVAGCTNDGSDAVAPTPAPPSDSTATDSDTGGAGTPTELVVPEIPGELARHVIAAGQDSGSVLSAAAAEEGTRLVVRAACVANDPSGRATYILLDARPGREGISMTERTLGESTFACDGQAIEAEVPALYSGPVQVLFSVLPEDTVDAYAVLTSRVE